MDPKHSIIKGLPCTYNKGHNQNYEKKTSFFTNVLSTVAISQTHYLFLIRDLLYNCFTSGSAF